MCSSVFETQFIKKLSNTESELKKALVIKKACLKLDSHLSKRFALFASFKAL